MSTAASLLPCRLAGVPIVDATIQDGALPPRRGPVMRMMARRADVVIANSQAGLDAFGIDPAKGLVVHNGFDPARWPLCDGGNAPDGPTTVVMAARMHPHKDYRSLLDAARVLSAEEPGGWRFLAIGSGGDRAALMAAYDDLVRAGVLRFPDGGTEVLGLVRDAHIGVLLTNAALHAEGLPNSIMEYMACGLPVVCTGTGGNPELVLDGRTGILVPPGDVPAVADALRSLRADPDEAERMGRLGRERIATVFTVEALVAGTLAAYEQALAGR
jgi:glycosyltransferase involved in cell wall biosynthesis